MSGGLHDSGHGRLPDRVDPTVKDVQEAWGNSSDPNAARFRRAIRDIRCLPPLAARIQNRIDISRAEFFGNADGVTAGSICISFP
jgi:hypothetical protein